MKSKEIKDSVNTPSVCLESPTGCYFQTAFYPKGSERFSNGQEQHLLIFCQKGHIRISSNLFNEEFLCAGEILFVPRGSDYHGVALSDVTLLIHYFNNTVCHVENCILAFLYTHKQIEHKEDKTYYYSKLTACGQLSHLLEGVDGYLSDKTHEPALWRLKHKELIWLLTKYYSSDELRLFFHPMTDEEVPFKSLVLAHYRKAEYTDKLAEMCGYNLHTFRRIFKEAFGISAHKWLTSKRAELIKYRLSLDFIPFSDIIQEFHFSSHQQFNRFCKDNLGNSPLNLREEYINETKSNDANQK